MFKSFFDAIKVYVYLSAVKNWQTTLIGLSGAIALVVYDLMQKGVVDKKTYIYAILSAAAGFVTKSANVTGGMTDAGVIPKSKTVMLNEFIKESPKASGKD